MNTVNITVRYPKWNSTDRSVGLHFSLDLHASAGSNEILERLFAGFGNSPTSEMLVWKSARIRSMSVGDFVCIDEYWYQCSNTGWKEVSEAHVNLVMEKGFNVWEKLFPDIEKKT